MPADAIERFYALPEATRKEFLWLMTLMLAVPLVGTGPEPHQQGEHGGTSATHENEPNARFSFEKIEVSTNERAQSYSESLHWRDMECSALPKPEHAISPSNYVDGFRRATSLEEPSVSNATLDQRNVNGAPSATGQSGTAQASAIEYRSYVFTISANISAPGQELARGFLIGVSPRTGEIFVAEYASSNELNQSFGVTKYAPSKFYPAAFGASVQVGFGMGDLTSGFLGQSQNISTPTTLSISASYNSKWSAFSVGPAVGGTNLLSTTNTEFKSVEYLRPSLIKFMNAFTHNYP